jgi:hypothetical protein
VGSRLDGHAQRLLGSEAALEGLWGGAQPTLLDHLAAFGVEETEVGVFVAYSVLR